MRAVYEESGEKGLASGKNLWHNSGAVSPQNQIWTGIEVVITALTRNRRGRVPTQAPEALTLLGFCRSSTQGASEFLRFFYALSQVRLTPVSRQLNMDRYRSGYNGPDSKSGVPARVPWVRIPPCPPFLYEKLLKFGSFSYFYRRFPLARCRIAALQSGGFATFLGICVFRRRKMVEISCPGRPLVVKVCGHESGFPLRGDVQMGVNIRRCAEG